MVIPLQELVDGNRSKPFARLNTINPNVGIFFDCSAVPILCGMRIAGRLVTFTQLLAEIAAVQRRIPVRHEQVDLDRILRPTCVDELCRTLFQDVEIIVGTHATHPSTEAALRYQAPPHPPITDVMGPPLSPPLRRTGPSPMSPSGIAPAACSPRRLSPAAPSGRRPRSGGSPSCSCRRTSASSRWRPESGRCPSRSCPR